MSDNPVHFRNWVDPEDIPATRYPESGERVIIVDGDLRARVMTLEAENARLHTLADAWAGVTVEKQTAEARAAELERERNQIRLWSEDAVNAIRHKLVETQAHAGRLAAALTQSKDELWGMRRHYDSHQNTYGDYSVEPDGEVLEMIDATLNALPAEALALWTAYEAEHEAAMSLRNTETRDAIDDWHRACADVEAAKAKGGGG